MRRDCLNRINIRQNILIKNTFGLSKYCRTTPLLNSLKIKSIFQLYEEYKILFLKQIRRNVLTKNIYETLASKYSSILKPPRESYFNILNTICNKYDFSISNINIKASLESISSSYTTENDGLVDSLKFLMGRTGTELFDNESKMLFNLLLVVQFNNN